MMQTRQKSFLSQSYMDSWQEFSYFFERSAAHHWDWVAITASNEKQKLFIEKQIFIRLKENRLPTRTNFIVVADPGGERIGSGGATLNVMIKIKEELLENELIEDKKILIIHSGGDSKRVPQYSIIGKLFAPVQRMLPNNYKSTLFDEILISVAGIPSRMKSGMMVMSGDIQIIFNTLQIDLNQKGAFALSLKESLQKGKNHGVFASNKDNVVEHFLHKQSEDTLRKAGAVNKLGNIDIDTGCIWFSKEIVEKIFSFVCENGILSKEKCELFINPATRLSLYADFIYPMAAKSTLEKYLKEEPEGEFTRNLEECRQIIWKALREYQLKVIKMSPAKFLHFGTTKELLEMVCSIENDHCLAWKKSISCNIIDYSKSAINNSIISKDATISAKSYIENSIIGNNVTINKNTVVSTVELEDVTIPSDVAIHGLKLEDGMFVARIYGINDNPNTSIEAGYLGHTLKKLLDITGIAIEDVWVSDKKSLWDARIFPISKDIKSAVLNSLDIYKIINGQANEYEIEKWKQGEKISFRESFDKADVAFTCKWIEQIENEVAVENCIEKLKGKYAIVDAAKALSSGEKLSGQIDILKQRIKLEPDVIIKMKICFLIDIAIKDNKTAFDRFYDNGYENTAYSYLKNDIISTALNKYPLEKTTCADKKAQVYLPVRVNFCCSPSDAAPYCIEYGGVMLNAALLINGTMPIWAKAELLTDNVIILESLDLKSKKTFTSLKELQKCTNTSDSFSLLKAAVIAAGIIPYNEIDDDIELSDILKKLGGGIHLSSKVDLPKGSGLGTSSILLAACIKAIHDLFLDKYDDKMIYAEVFAAEQIMETGGGWQDQVGGFTDGIKLSKTLPGIVQNIDIEKIVLDTNVKGELDDRFVLIFSGQRRLAKNVLRREMNRCLNGSKDALIAMDKIQDLGVLMAYDLKRGKIDSFAMKLSEQFELVKILDQGASNTCIEYIFDVCDDLIVGKSICGAGGGGFLQVILKKGVTKNQLAQRISESFEGCGVELWDCKLI